MQFRRNGHIKLYVTAEDYVWTSYLLLGKVNSVKLNGAE